MNNEDDKTRVPLLFPYLLILLSISAIKLEFVLSLVSDVVSPPVKEERREEKEVSAFKENAMH